MKSDLYQSVISFLIKFGSGISAYILFLTASSNLSSADYGLFSIVFSLSVLLGIAGSMGLQIFIVKEFEYQRLINGTAGLRAVLQYSYKILSLSAIPTFLAFFVISQLVTEEMSTPTVLLGGVLSVLYALSQASFGMLRALGRTQFAVFSRDLMWRLGSIPLIAFFVTTRDGVSAAILVVSFVLLIVVLSHYFLVIKVTKGYERNRLEIDYKNWISTTFGLGLIGVISSADFYIYTVMIGYLLSSNDAGIFFTALKTAELLNMFLMAVTLIMAPKISKYIAAKDTEMLQLQCNLSLVLQLIPLIACLIVILPMSSYILSLFNQLYAPYWPLLCLLAIIMAFNALTGATVLMMQIGGMHWLQVALQGGWLIFSIIALVPLSREFGVYGVAYSFGLSKLMWNIFAIYFIKKNLGVDPSILGLFAKSGGGIKLLLLELKKQARFGG